MLLGWAMVTILLKLSLGSGNIDRVTTIAAWPISDEPSEIGMGPTVRTRSSFLNGFVPRAAAVPWSSTRECPAGLQGPLYW